MRKLCPLTQEQNQAQWEMMLIEWEPKWNKLRKHMMIFSTLRDGSNTALTKLKNGWQDLKYNAYPKWGEMQPPSGIW